MSDESIREAERRFRETGAVEDEAAFVLARVRAGALERSRVELAAHCGHPAALAALGATEPTRDLERWCGGLQRFGHEVLVRAAHAAVRSVVHFWNERPDPAVSQNGEASPGEQTAAVGEWLSCPCEEHVRECLDTLPPTPRDALVTEHGEEPWALAHDAADELILSVKRPSFAVSAIRSAALALRATGGSTAVLRPSSDLVTAEREIGERIREALVSWALG